MFWIHDYDSMKALIKYAEWRLSRLLPSVFQSSHSLKINDKLESIGMITGLVSNEVEAVVASSSGLFESFFQKCLKWILLAIIIVGGAYIIHKVTYVPGTLYGSIKISDIY